MKRNKIMNIILMCLKDMVQQLVSSLYNPLLCIFLFVSSTSVPVFCVIIAPESMNE